MLPYEFYKTVHVLGIMLLFSSLGATAILGVLSDHPAAPKTRKLLVATHGTALVFLLVAGFGLLARINASANAPWVIGKLLIWIALGVGTLLPKRMPSKGGLWFFLFVALGVISAGLAIYKPGM